MVSEGSDVTIVTYGLGVQWAESILNANFFDQRRPHDLRTLLPWDQDSVMASVRKTVGL